MEIVSIGRVSANETLISIDFAFFGIPLHFFSRCSTTTEKILRQNARQEEDKLRHYAHNMHMNMMRARVKSAQLLLEGRSMSAK